MSELLDQLNEPQREAAACTDGPVMIIAGAGSGKTRTLTYRIAHLMELGVDPFHILALTFTNKAANEMKERIIKLVGGEGRNLWMGTFHSVFARVLRAEATKLGYTSSFTIYDTDDSKAAIKQIVKQLNLDPKTYKPSFVLNRISMAKSNLLSPKDYQENPEIYQTDIDSKRPAIGQIYVMYDQRLHNSNAMDFDDLLFNMNILLRDFPDVLLKYQQRFQYIMVDEYQDTNYAQYLIVKKLAARNQNICVVGDDAQSIYAFRGANIQNIFNFKRDYPDMHLFKLEQNYRSTQNIVNAANSIISRNRDQIQKELWSDNGVGSRIRLIRAVDEKDEGMRVADSIQNFRLGEDAEYRDFAVLYRQNSLSRSVEDALRKMNIPYKIYQGLSFYGRREVKDVLAYLRLAINPHDDESLVRVINYPTRGIGQTTMDKIRVAAADNDISIWTVLENIQSFGLPIQSGAVQKITEFVYMIKRFESQVPSVDAFTLAKQIVYASGIIKALREEDDPESAERIENIDELLNSVQEFCEEPGNPGKSGKSGISGKSGESPTHPRRVPAAGAPLHLRGQGQRQGRQQGLPDDHPRRQGPGVPLRLRRRHGGAALPLVPGQQPRRAGGGTPPVLRRRDARREAGDPQLRPDALQQRPAHGRRGEPLRGGDRPAVHRDSLRAPQHARTRHPAARLLQRRQTRARTAGPLQEESRPHLRQPRPGGGQQPGGNQQHHARHEGQPREIRHRQGARRRGRRRLPQGHRLLRGRRPEATDAQIRQALRGRVMMNEE